MSLVKRNNVIVPSIFNEFLRPDWFGGLDSYTNSVPAVNVKHSDTGFTLELALPGFKKDDVNIEVDKNVLTVSSEIETKEENTEGGYTRREFRTAAFKRAFTLPKSVDEAQIKANFEDGILRLELPKKEAALPKPKRLIEIG